MNQDPFFFSDSNDDQNGGDPKNDRNDRNDREKTETYQGEPLFERPPVRAYDFRLAARRLLWGRFFWAALLAFLVASLLSALNFGTSFEITIDARSAQNLVNSTDLSDTETFLQEVIDLLRDTFLDSWFYTAVGAVLTLALGMFVGSPVHIGYNKFLLNVANRDERNVRVGVLFDAFRPGTYQKAVRLGALYTGIALLTQIPQFAGTAVFFTALLKDPVTTDTFLLAEWAMVGGTLISALLRIVVYNTYSFAYFLAAEDPEIGAVEALRRSRRMMRGNKWRLFCLQFSYVGWIILAALVTCGIGALVLQPFINEAEALFYTQVADHGSKKKTSGDEDVWQRFDRS